MIPSLAGPAGTSCQAEAPGSDARAPGASSIRSDVAARQEFIRKLEDAAYGVSPRASQQCMDALSHLLPSLPAWPPDLRLTWWPPAVPLQALAGEAPHVLAVSMQERTGRPKLVVDWLQGVATGAAALPAHSRYRRELDVGLHDAFDAIATGLDMASARFGGRSMADPDDPGHPGYSRHRSGMPLRLALGAWLQSGGAPDWQVPEIAWLHSGAAGCAAAPASNRPALPTVPQQRSTSSLLPMLPRPAASSVSATEPDLTVSSVRAAEGPAAGMATVVQALAAELRQGCWNTLLEEIVLQLATRLPVVHPDHSHALDMVHGDRTVTYCVKPRGGYRLRLRRMDQGAPWRYKVEAHLENRRPHYEGPDGLLEALLPRQRLSGRYPAAQVRSELASLMQANPTLVRLCAALHERFPDHPQPDVLLRLCLRAGQLTDAGRQLLDPSIPHRDPTAQDLVRWFSEICLQPGRRLQNFIDDGVDILKAHHLFGPIGLTPAAHQLLGAHDMVHPAYLPMANWRAHLEPELAALLYAYQTRKNLSVYLGCSEPTLQKYCGSSWAGARDRAERWQSEDALCMPP